MECVKLNQCQLDELHHIVRNSSLCLLLIIRHLARTTSDENFSEDYLNMALENLKNIEEALPQNQNDISSGG